jgi:hypothetical protein
MLSAEGGVEIETVAVENPDAIVLLHINPVDGLSLAVARDAAVRASIDDEAVDGVADMLVKLYTCFTQGDCDLAEINPLILRPDGGVHALDAKVSLDNNAAFRHPEWDEFRATEELDEREQLARTHDLQYIGLDGTVGIIANGAGLAMSTLDVVNQVGGTAANFLDIGGGANADMMAAALGVINSDENVKSILINIFGGITRGEEVAKGIVEALGRVDLRAPIVIRLDGTNAAEGREILANAGIPSRSSPPSPPCWKPPVRPWHSRTEPTDHGHLRQRRYEGHRAGPHRWAGQVPRPAQPGLRHPGRRRCHAGQGRHRRRRHSGVQLGCRGRRRHRRHRLVHRRAAQGRQRSHPRSCCRRHRLHRLHHRGHPRPGRGEGVQHAAARLPRTRACWAPTARASSAQASATSASPPARSPRCPPPAGPTWASSAARARSPIRRCTS